MVSKKNKQLQETRIKVAILEDNATLVLGMRAELDKPDIFICGVSDNSDIFLEHILAYQPDIAIVDLRILYDFDAGIESIIKAKKLSPETKFIVYTAYDKNENFHKGIQIGIRAFLSKNIYEKPLDDVVRIVFNGGTYYGDFLSSYLHEIKEYKDEDEDEKDKTFKDTLSKREIEILNLLDSGLSSQEIAIKLVVSDNTVKAHTKNIRAKLKVQSTIEALRVYRMHFIGKNSD